MVSQAHPLAGGRLPRGQLILADGTAARIYQLFHDGRFVLLESAGSAALTEANVNEVAIGRQLFEHRRHGNEGSARTMRIRGALE